MKLIFSTKHFLSKSSLASFRFLMRLSFPIVNPEIKKLVFSLRIVKVLPFSTCLEAQECNEHAIVIFKHTNKELKIIGHAPIELPSLLIYFFTEDKENELSVFLTRKKNTKLDLLFQKNIEY